MLEVPDIPVVATVHRAYMPPGEGWGETQWRFELEHGLRFPYVAEVSGDIVGVASFWDEEAWLYLATLLVLPEHRRKGIGRMLVRKGEALARERGRERIALHVRADNRIAREFYARLGYATVALSEIRYPDGTPGDRLEKRL